MYMKKINILWGINLILFVAVVFLGIEQASRGADISILERKIDTSISQKRELSEQIFNTSSDSKIVEKSNELGFIKSTDVYYFKTDDVFALLPVR